MRPPPITPAGVEDEAQQLEQHGTGITVCREFTDLPKSALPMLSRLGPHIAPDAVLITKTCRIFRAMLRHVCPVMHVRLETRAVLLAVSVLASIIASP
jgi:hypothetical protein